MVGCMCLVLLSEKRLKLFFTTTLCMCSMCIFPAKHGSRPAHFHLCNFRWRVYDADLWRITVWLHRGQIWAQKCVISFNFIDGYLNNKYGMPAKLCIGGLRSPHHVALSSSLPRSIGRRTGLFYARLLEEGKRQM